MLEKAAPLEDEDQVCGVDRAEPVGRDDYRLSSESRSGWSGKPSKPSVLGLRVAEELLPRAVARDGDGGDEADVPRVELVLELVRVERRIVLRHHDVRVATARRFDPL